jgi:hypothetical protein
MILSQDFTRVATFKTRKGDISLFMDPRGGIHNCETEQGWSDHGEYVKNHPELFPPNVKTAEQAVAAGWTRIGSLGDSPLYIDTKQLTTPLLSRLQDLVLKIREEVGDIDEIDLHCGPIEGIIYWEDFLTSKYPGEVRRYVA